MFQVRSNNWGPLLAETVTVEGPFVIMTGVTTWDGKPFKPVCWIPVSDVMLIVPESE